MKIKLNEVKDLRDYMEDKKFENFICDLEETEDYMDILEDIMIDVKHIVSEYLSEAIKCNFDTEVLSIDFGIPNDIIDILKRFDNSEIDTYN